MHLKPLLIGLFLATPALGVIRIIPMGDSLTSGVGSSEMGGYRQVVKANLGDAIDFLGRKDDGPFRDNQDEGWGGFTIKMIRDQVVPTIMDHSGFGDAILLTAGTNEFVWTQNPTADGAAARAAAALVDMRSLINTTFNYAGFQPLYVSTIPAIRDWNHPDNTYTYPEVDLFNSGLHTLVNEFHDDGYDIRFVDTTSTLNLQTDFYDGIHPNDLGYAKIGAAWTNALNGVAPEPATGTLALATLAMVATNRRRRSR